jgi:hypothetical protein
MNLVHEVWEEEKGLVTVCLAGPDGDRARALLGAGARLLRTFEANSHFEAMTVHNARMGREPYTSSEPWDFQPYPAEWFERQQRAAEQWRELHARLVGEKP